METQDGAYGNKRTKLVMPRRPTIKSSANMHMFKLKLTHTIARKGLGPACASDKTNIEDLNDKMRDKVSILCAEILDEVEGPLRGEPELVRHLLELTQDVNSELYQHGGRVLKMIVDGYSLTDDSTEMIQLSKMKHAKLMTIKLEKNDSGEMVKAHLDALIAETMNLGYDHLTLVKFKEHLDMINNEPKCPHC